MVFQNAVLQKNLNFLDMKNMKQPARGMLEVSSNLVMQQVTSGREHQLQRYVILVSLKL